MNTITELTLSERLDKMLEKTKLRLEKRKEKLILIKLSKDKGFVSKVYGDGHIWEFVSHKQEDLRFYLWCCELHRWLFETQDFAPYIDDNIHPKEFIIELTYILNQLPNKK